MCKHSTDYHLLLRMIHDANTGNVQINVMVLGGTPPTPEQLKEKVPFMLHDAVHARYMDGDLVEPEADELHTMIGGYTIWKDARV